MSTFASSPDVSHLVALSLFAFSVLFDIWMSRRFFYRLNNELLSHANCALKNNLKIDVSKDDGALIHSLFSNYSRCIFLNVIVLFVVFSLELLNVINFGFSFISTLLLFSSLSFIYFDIKGIYVLRRCVVRYP